MHLFACVHILNACVRIFFSFKFGLLSLTPYIHTSEREKEEVNIFGMDFSENLKDIIRALRILSNYIWSYFCSQPQLIPKRNELRFCMLCLQ